MPFVHSQGARVYWRSQGLPGAPPLVLLHNIGGDMTLFDRSAPFLEQEFNLLRVDLRGHGASDAPEAEYSLALMARDVGAAMDAAGVARAPICGVSLGGMVAMQMAIDAPARVTGLALACTSPQMDPALWPERIASARESGMARIAEGWASRHFSEAFARDCPALTESRAEAMRTMTPAGYIGAAAAIRDMDILSGLAGVAVPTTVIAGRRDIATPHRGHGDRIVATISGAETAFLPGAHLTCIENPDMFAAAVAALARRSLPQA